jgi:hypothetical protein
MRRRAFLLAALALFTIAGPLSATPAVLGTGTFRDGDAIHRGSGDLRIVRSDDGTVRVDMRGMQIVPGPNLFVYLVAEPDPLFPEDVTAKFRSLGKLKGLTGDQSYVVPAGVDIAEWGSVVVWCDTFKTAFAIATIRRP